MRNSTMLLAALVLLAGCSERESDVPAEAPEPVVEQTATRESEGNSGGGAANAAPENAVAPAEPAAEPKPASACLIQDGKPVPANRLRAIGTEPFWGARIEGRCVTYSHPEDQDGTRVWTKFSGTAATGTWTGSLGGKPFVLRTQPEAGCSDGMSDNRYPIAVALTVGGEQRSGCAEPL